MRPLSTFALEIQRGENYELLHVSVVLSPPLSDVMGVLRLTPSAFRLAATRSRQASDGFGFRVLLPLCRVALRSRRDAA